MSVSQVLFAFAWVALICTATGKKQACEEHPAPGPCDYSIPRWYFDSHRQKCTKFIWGGCRGSVPFKTRRDCVRAECGSLETPKPSPLALAESCIRWPNVGTGNRNATRWYFDPRTQKCTSYIWKGGNSGVLPFDTRRDCLLARCAENRCSVAPVTGPCKALIRGYYFDSEKKTCKAFLWGGCLGVLPFRTREQCEGRCPIGPEPCLQEPDPGRCLAAFPRYFFNPKTKKCEKFIWGGCGGTAPFESMSDCTAAKCPCKLQIDGGPCKDFVSRWYYDEVFNSCSTFFYGGCEGTVPFDTESQCVAENCSSVVDEGSDFTPMYGL